MGGLEAITCTYNRYLYDKQFIGPHQEGLG